MFLKLPACDIRLEVQITSRIRENREPPHRAVQSSVAVSTASAPALALAILYFVRRSWLHSMQCPFG